MIATGKKKARRKESHRLGYRHTNITQHPMHTQWRSQWGSIKQLPPPRNSVKRLSGSSKIGLIRQLKRVSGVAKGEGNGTVSHPTRNSTKKILGIWQLTK